MKLSIITINYNNREGLQKTLKSVFSQSFTDFEWIVIDGGSTDGSKELIAENSDKIAYWVSEKDRGIYHAMNKGLEKANGVYCQFLNSGDSFINEDVLNQVFQVNNLSDVNYGDIWLLEEERIIEKRTYPAQINLSFLFKAPLGHQAAFFRTDLAKTIKYKEQYKISADRAFFLEFYVRGFSFNYLNIPIAFFDNEGISSKQSTFNSRQKQFYSIKRDFFSDQVVKDIERLLFVEEEFLFVKRIWPINTLYCLFKWIKKISR